AWSAIGSPAPSPRKCPLRKFPPNRPCNHLPSSHVHLSCERTGRRDMETPLKISFQGSDTSEALSALIGEHVEALEKVYGRLTACHVMVQVPDRHSGLFAVHIHIAMPGGADVNIDHTPTSDERFHDPQFAVNDAFR